jgi:site-specific DNA-methyltransferase (adenine-specific)
MANEWATQKSRSGSVCSRCGKSIVNWEGWGSALKPANEPICLARKPLSEKSIAENVLKWKTGGLNIDGCRIGFRDENDKQNAKPGSLNATGENSMFGLKSGNEQNDDGRFPANIILDESAAKMLDEQSGVSKSSGSVRKKDTETDPSSFDLKKKVGNNSNVYAGQEGGASRFFYVAKVSKKERNLGLDGFEENTTNTKGHGLDRVCMNEGCGVSMLKPQDCKCDEPDWRVKPKKNSHPTVKPVNLMSYLCKLITPPNGIVLDPFMGSGSTGIAALLNDFRFVGMELDNDYFKIAEARISSYEDYRKFLKK